MDMGNLSKRQQSDQRSENSPYVFLFKTQLIIILTNNDNNYDTNHYNYKIVISPRKFYEI